MTESPHSAVKLPHSAVDSPYSVTELPYFVVESPYYTVESLYSVAELPYSVAKYSSHFKWDSCILPELASRDCESSRFRAVGAPFQRIGDPESLFTPLPG